MARASIVLVVGVALAAAPPHGAFADEAAAEDRCRGFHSLFDPLPDACLEVIDTDRPHQTDTPHVVPAGHTQVESAIAAVQLGGTLDGSDTRTHLVLLEDTYKFGLVTRVDVQLLFKHADYVLDAHRFVAPGP